MLSKEDLAEVESLLTFIQLELKDKQRRVLLMGAVDELEELFRTKLEVREIQLPEKL